MILKPESILHYLPSGLITRQMKILDSMRFSLENIDENYKSLLSEFVDVSIKKEKPSKINAPFMVFN